MLTKMPRQRSKYTMTDLKTFILTFYEENGRPPKTREIRILSKQGKAPSCFAFHQHGGLNWVIEQAGLNPVNKKAGWDAPDDIRRQFLSFARDFISKQGRPPQRTDIDQAAQKGLSPSSARVKRCTGKSPAQFMYDLGLTNNRPMVQNRVVQ